MLFVSNSVLHGEQVPFIVLNVSEPSKVHRGASEVI